MSDHLKSVRNLLNQARTHQTLHRTEQTLVGAIEGLLEWAELQAGNLPKLSDGSFGRHDPDCWNCSGTGKRKPRLADDLVVDCDCVREQTHQDNTPIPRDLNPLISLKSWDNPGDRTEARPFDKDTDCPGCLEKLDEKADAGEAFCGPCRKSGRAAAYMRGCQAAEAEHASEIAAYEHDIKGFVERTSELHDRLVTIVDEAFGLQPVQETEELLTLLEHKLSEDRIAQRKRISELEAQLATKLELVCLGCQKTVRADDCPEWQHDDCGGLGFDEKCTCIRCCDMRAALNRTMSLCSTCGNKRCPKATYHNNECTGSNEPGQPGSDY